MKIIDVNAGFGFWPIQHFSTTSLEDFAKEQAELGIDETWVSAIESILFPEPDTHDFRLFEKLGSYPNLKAVKTVNPLLANWKKSLEEALGRFPLAAVKLFPNYHGYSLDLPEVDAVCLWAAERRLPVLVQMRVNDERNQPAFLQVDGVSAAALVSLAQRHPAALLIALCSYIGDLEELAKGGPNLLADISFQDRWNPVAYAVEVLGPERVVFGTHSAFLHGCAALMKLRHHRVEPALQERVASLNVLSPRLSAAPSV